MTGIVVDASVAVQCVVDEEHSVAAMRLMTAHALFAPAHWLAEAANAVWNKSRRGEFDANSAAERAAWLAEVAVQTTPLSDLLKPAFTLSSAHAISLYDSLYVVLAVEKRLTLMTADVKLIRTLRLGGLGKIAVWIGDYA